jgi:hypothetical protein
VFDESGADEPPEVAGGNALTPEILQLQRELEHGLAELLGFLMGFAEQLERTPARRARIGCVPKRLLVI